MRKVLLAVGLGVTLIATACGGDDSPSTSTSTGKPASRANTVTVEATEYGYSAPAEITGGVVNLELVNSGAEPHEFAFVKLEKGKTIDDLAGALEAGGRAPWAVEMSGVGVLGPGLSTSMERTLEPGTYSFFCFLPSPEGKPHVALGMVGGFEVSGDSGAEQLEPDYVMSSTDDGFEVPSIEAGRHLVEFRNEGTKTHEFALISFEPGKGERDLGKWFGGGYQGEAPAVFPGGMQSIEPGTAVVMAIEFVSGRTYTLQDFPNKLSADIKIP